MDIKERTKGTEYQCPKCKKWFDEKEKAENCFLNPNHVHKYGLGDRVKVKYFEDGLDYATNLDATIIGIGFREAKGHLRYPVYIFGPSWCEFGSREYDETAIVKLIKKYELED